MYRYGNYAGYYGYRVGAIAEDHRLLALRREWFTGRRCLDIGCNEGLVPLTLAVRFRTASVQGVDIDASLVRRAGRNLRSMQRAASEAAAEAATLGAGGDLDGDKAALAAAVPALEGVTFTCVPPHAQAACFASHPSLLAGVATCWTCPSPPASTPSCV